MKHSNVRVFDSSAQAIAFPLGGIGTGNISLGARGDLRDWEIFNHPSKGRILPTTFFAIRAQLPGQPPVVRVLEGPIQAPHTFPHGYHPHNSGGLPRLDGAAFRGEYPFAFIDFDDADLPVKVELEAFTPLIPLNAEDSGIPCVILTYTVTNPTDQSIPVTVVGSVTNPIGKTRQDYFTKVWLNDIGRPTNELRDENGMRGIYMYNKQLDSNDLTYGSFGLTTDFPDITAKTTWIRGAWWDYLQAFWDDLTVDGLLDDTGEGEPGERMATGSLGLVATLAPGEVKTMRFILTWYFPNRLRAWDTQVVQDLGLDVENIDHIQNHYATVFADAWAVARYVCDELPRLEADTRKFHEALFGSTLPPLVIDALSSNIVPLRSTTCFWLEDGRFYGWEGCHDESGSCPGNCTHVWSYAYTLAYLFPSLERSMRRTEFLVETNDIGFMNFRSFRTFHAQAAGKWYSPTRRAAVDGQMGSILRVYREWQLSGDRAFLNDVWPGVKRAMTYAVDHWDADHDGVLVGEQHNTYDIEFQGANPLATFYYLAALRAVEEMARVLGEPEVAAYHRQLFDRGQQGADELMWNGEFYVQVLDDINQYKYQHGSGCLSDQLLGQLHARALNLGSLLPEDHVHRAVKAIFDYNFKSNFRDHANCQRAFAVNDESGLLLCTWPNGQRPALPIVYSDEVWTGIEYQVAAHLIYEGWVDEGLLLVQAVRDRYNGVNRNPWNEIECGHHYARSMASWTVLLALTGMHSDLGRGEMSFAPVAQIVPADGLFRTFWSNGQAWGVYSQQRDPSTGEVVPSIEVLGGDLGSVSITACGRILSPTKTLIGRETSS